MPWTLHTLLFGTQDHKSRFSAKNRFPAKNYFFRLFFRKFHIFFNFFSFYFYLFFRFLIFFESIQSGSSVFEKRDQKNRKKSKKKFEKKKNPKKMSKKSNFWRENEFCGPEYQIFIYRVLWRP